MSKENSILAVVGVIIVTLLVTGALVAVFILSPSFHSIFVRPATDTVASVIGKADGVDVQSIASRREVIGTVVFGIFTLMIALQVVIFGAAIIVCKRILNSAGDVSLKLKKFDSAAIFFDLPLYAGLFGTVSSFMVIAFSRESSLLMAYSTTLLGIVFSVILHITVLYPAKRQLLNGHAR